MRGSARNNRFFTAGQRVARAFAKWMPWTFIGVILILVYFGAKSVVSLAADAKDAATLTAAELKDKIDELKWTLEMIVATAGLFTIAQGVAAGFSAKSFSDQAEGMLAEIKGRFPVFQLFEERRKEANANLPNLDLALTQIAPAQSLGGRAYGNLPLKLRQQLLSAERTFPYEFVGRDEPPDVFSRNLRRLAQFYSAKFTYEWERGSASLGDIEHALYLLSLAIRTAGSSFYLLNDLGNVHVVYFKVLNSLPSPAMNPLLTELQDALNRARSCFEDSIKAQRRQLRAYYNLAVIEADQVPKLAPVDPPDQGLRLAIKYLQEGLKFKEWEEGPIREFTCNALYNLACHHARLAAYTMLAAQKECAERAAVCTLRKAASLGLINPEYVSADFTNKKGDFFTLLTSVGQETRIVLKSLQHKLSVNYKKAERL